MKKSIKLLMVLSIFCLAIAGCGKEASTSFLVSEKIPTDEEQELSEEERLKQEEEDRLREEEFAVDDTLRNITFGRYEQDGNLDNGKEPIDWIVLTYDEEKALVISRFILDNKCFNEGFEEADWENSTIRKWLNGDFINSAFSDAEQERIIESFLTPEMIKEEEKVEVHEAGDVPEGSEEGVEGSGVEDGSATSVISEAVETPEVKGTYDKVFLLSYDEYLYYFDLYETNEELLFEEHPKFRPSGDVLDNRIGINSRYAIDRGVFTLTEEKYNLLDYKEKDIPELAINAGWWWLRTTGADLDEAMDVKTDGTVRTTGHLVGEEHDGVRPAMWIQIEGENATFEEEPEKSEIEATESNTTEE